MADLGNIGFATHRTSVLHGGMVSGVVHNEAGAAAARTVIAYHRTTGQQSGGAKSDPATGAYTLLTGITYGTDEHFVVEINPDGSQNHRIRGFVTPNKGF